MTKKVYVLLRDGQEVESFEEKHLAKEAFEVAAAKGEFTDDLVLEEVREIAKATRGVVVKNVRTRVTKKQKGAAVTA